MSQILDLYSWLLYPPIHLMKVELVIAFAALAFVQIGYSKPFPVKFGPNYTSIKTPASRIIATVLITFVVMSMFLMALLALGPSVSLSVLCVLLCCPVILVVLLQKPITLRLLNDGTYQYTKGWMPGLRRSSQGSQASIPGVTVRLMWASHSKVYDCRIRLEDGMELSLGRSSDKQVALRYFTDNNALAHLPILKDPLNLLFDNS